MTLQTIFTIACICLGLSALCVLILIPVKMQNEVVDLRAIALSSTALVFFVIGFLFLGHVYIAGGLPDASSLESVR